MDRRGFNKRAILLGLGGQAALTQSGNAANQPSEDYYEEPAKKLPIRKFDVVVAGGGTAGVFAALAAARLGANTMLMEAKGYCGGIATEGGTAIHSFYNLYTAFPGCKKRKVVRGIPAEFMDRLIAKGGCTGFPEMETGRGYDSICTAVDTELYKVQAFEMLKEAGVFVALNTLLVDAISTTMCLCTDSMILPRDCKSKMVARMASPIAPSVSRASTISMPPAC